MNRLRRLLTAAIVATFIAGCGVPSQSTPVRVNPADLPSPLVAPDTPVSPPGTVRPGQSAVRVYFVRDARLVGLAREATGTSAADRIDATIAALLAGPSQNEQATGLATTLPPGLVLRIAGTTGTRVQLELGGEIGGRSATENVLTVGQIVLSLTSLASVDEVSFVQDGSPAQALLPGGALTDKPLTATDYAPLTAR
ncbi:hypothetical protein GCM10009789_86690 [Kribbella sancticallisti]|uniref:GerMN domain-containing protein n=1 Tax=Kribbella sancticallisti TaxID=460087 RepID=A0ABP4QRF9_9ACTN